MNFVLTWDKDFVVHCWLDELRNGHDSRDLTTETVPHLLYQHLLNHFKRKVYSIIINYIRFKLSIVSINKEAQETHLLMLCASTGNNYKIENNKLSLIEVDKDFKENKSETLINTIQKGIDAKNGQTDQSTLNLTFHFTKTHNLYF